MPCGLPIEGQPLRIHSKMVGNSFLRLNCVTWQVNRKHAVGGRGDLGRPLSSLNFLFPQRKGGKRGHSSTSQ
eukprot:5786367-Amphidinium_carterae.1